MIKKKYKICVVGLGYVGLPLMYELSSFFDVIGIDADRNRVSELKKSFDRNLEFSKKKLDRICKKVFLNEKKFVLKSNVYIITVPTPVYGNNKPDFRSLLSACTYVGKNLKNNDTVIIESTVSPGTVEGPCKKILSLNKINFNLCFSPERINVGDKQHTLSNLVKVISSDTKTGLKICDEIYNKICKKVYKAKNIKTAEMAKIFENIQRDVNIALTNQGSVIANKLGISFTDVLETCSTKWNSLNFYPGLVGGHCVSIDPYYLIDDCKKKNIDSSIISLCRSYNERFVNLVYNKIVKLVKKIKKPKILFVGLSFKDGVVDFRNSKYIKLYKMLKKLFFVRVLESEQPLKKSGIKNVKLDNNKKNLGNYNFIIVCSINYFLKNNIKYIFSNKIKKKYLLNLSSKFKYDKNNTNIKLINF